MKSDFIFGIRPVIEAINSGKEIEKIFFKKDLQGELFKELLALVRQHNISFQFVPIERLNRITRKNHQGVVAYLSLIEYTQLDQLIPLIFERGDNPFVIVLDGVTDVRNLGAIARTAECAGVHAIIIPDQNSARINADAMKVSAGALHNIPVSRVKDMSKTLKYLKDSGLSLVVATEKTEDYYYKEDLNKPLAIIMGAEDKGVSQKLLVHCDSKVKIPIEGTISSLNVSAAAAVVIYEVVRQRSLD